MFVTTGHELRTSAVASLTACIYRQLGVFMLIKILLRYAKNRRIKTVLEISYVFKVLTYSRYMDIGKLYNIRRFNAVAIVKPMSLVFCNMRNDL
jgi:hypothetical protein